MVKGGDDSKKEVKKDQIKMGNILLLINEMVLPDHFWIGIKTADDRIN